MIAEFLSPRGSQARIGLRIPDGSEVDSENLVVYEFDSNYWGCFCVQEGADIKILSTF